jgi:pimeloyl-ACP methyl ester carboxylesterase
MATTPRSLRPATSRPEWLPWSAFPFQSRFRDIDGKRIHYLDEGSGPALLFVSAGQWSFMFRDVIMRLRGKFRCLALDFPGSGLSPEASEPTAVRSSAPGAPAAAAARRCRFWPGCCASTR